MSSEIEKNDEKEYSPMIQTLMDYGKNCIISVKNNNKIAAKTILKSMIDSVNKYHLTSLYAVQYDVYSFMKRLQKSRKNKNKNIIDKDNDVKLVLKRDKNIKTPDLDAIVIDIDLTEQYVNNLIEHTRKFEKNLCKKRNEYLSNHINTLRDISKNKFYESVENGNKLKNIVKKFVIIC